MTGRYARCSVGRQKWFWATWASTDDLFDGKLSATGYASTVEEAEAHAKQALTTEEKIQEPAGYAANVHRRRCMKERAKTTSDAKDAGRVEYVYSDWWSDYDGSRSSSKHRIVKKTAKRIYVEARSEKWEDDQGQPYYDVRTIALDRAEFEEHGEAFGGPRGNRQYYHDRPYEERTEALPTVPCFVALGLAPPITSADVSRAYRRKAKLYHPDHGGDPEKFKAIQRAYEEALTLVSRQAG